MDSKQMRTLMHNLNSTLSSLVQSVDIMANCIDEDFNLVKKMVPMAQERGKSALEIWAEIKHEIKASLEE